MGLLDIPGDILNHLHRALALVPTTLLPMVIFSGGMTPIKSMPDSGYIDAYRISMLMPTRWGLEELLREYDSYGDGYPIGSGSYQIGVARIYGTSIDYFVVSLGL